MATYSLGDTPWRPTPNTLTGHLASLPIALSGEHGFAAGTDLTDESGSWIVASNRRVALNNTPLIMRDSANREAIRIDQTAGIGITIDTGPNFGEYPLGPDSWQPTPLGNLSWTDRAEGDDPIARLGFWTHPSYGTKDFRLTVLPYEVDPRGLTSGFYGEKESKISIDAWADEDTGLRAGLTLISSTADVGMVSQSALLITANEIVVMGTDATRRPILSCAFGTFAKLRSNNLNLAGLINADTTALNRGDVYVDESGYLKVYGV